MPLDVRLSGVEARMAPLETRVTGTEDRVAPLEARVTGTEGRMAPLEARLAALEGAWREHVPSFLNAVGTVSAFGHELARARQDMAASTRASAEVGEELARARQDLAASARASAEMGEGLARFEQATSPRLDQTQVRLDNADRSIASLWERIEFVRREVLFEMNHGGAAPTDTAPDIAKRVVAPEKVAAAKAAGALRLNLGCGHIPLPGHINVDMRELPGIDVVAEAGDLPFEPGSVDEIASAHLLEHFPQETLRRRLLPYWHRLLRPGGGFRAVTPDAAAMLAAASKGEYPFEDFREVVFGAQDYAGDYHYNLFTPDSLRELLEETGFDRVEVPASGRRNGKCFEFEITARRP